MLRHVAYAMFSLDSCILCTGLFDQHLSDNQSWFAITDEQHKQNIWVCLLVFETGLSLLVFETGVSHRLTSFCLLDAIS